MSSPSVAWMNGQLVPFAEASVPLEDRGLQFGESLYEVVAITAKGAQKIPAHVERMRWGAELMGIEAPDEATWWRMVDQLLEREALSEGLLYAQLTGGVAPRAHLPAERPRPSFFGYVRPFAFPREERTRRGIRAVTNVDLRWARCDVKSTMLLPNILAKAEARGRGADEALLVGAEGDVREGASSSLLIVERGELFAPPQTSRVLPGLTGPLARELAQESGRKVAFARLPVERVREADEVMICSTSQLVMPITRLDERPIANGEAGPIALELAQRLRQHYGIE